MTNAAGDAALWGALGRDCITALYRIFDENPVRESFLKVLFLHPSLQAYVV